MAIQQTHMRGSQAVRVAPDDFIRYFSDLPAHGETVSAFFGQWDRLTDLTLGALRPDQTVMVLRRTASAYANHGRAVFGDGFRLKLQNVLDKWQHHALHHLSDFNARHLEGTIWAFASLGIQPAPAFMAQWSRRATLKIPAADHIEMTNIIWSHAVLGLRPNDMVMDAWAQNLDKSLDTMRLRDAAMTMWSLAVLDVAAPGYDYKKCARACLDRIEEMAIKTATPDNIKELANIRDACLWFDFDNTQPAPLHRGNKSSSLETDLRMVFRRGAIKILGADATRIDELDKRTDWAVQTDCGRVLHVEADGWTHLIRGSNGNFRYDGRTLFQTALMRKVRPGHVFVRIPCTSVHAAEKADGYLSAVKVRNVFDAAAKAAPANAEGRAFVMAFTGNEMRLQPLGV